MNRDNVHAELRRCVVFFVGLCLCQDVVAQHDALVLRHTYNDRDMPALATTFSPDGKTIAVGFGPSVTAWETAEGERVLVFEDFDIRVLASISSLAFSPNGRLLLAGDDVGYITVWDLTKNELVRNFLLPVHENYTGLSASVAGVAFTQNGREIVALRGHLLTFWDTESGEELRRVALNRPVPRGERESGQMTLLDDGPLALFSFSSSWSRIIDIETGEVQQVFENEEVALSGDQSKLLSISEAEGTCTLSDPASAAALRNYDGNCSGRTPALSPNGYILAYSRENVIHLDALRTSGAREELTTLTPETDGTEQFRELQISPTGNHLAARLSRSVHLYDISEFPSSVRGSGRYDQ